MRFELVQEIFEEQADSHPDSVAVEEEGSRVSYSELEARANRLARHLRSRGVSRGSIVAILLPRSIEAYVSILASLKAGAAYVPVDPEYPADRVSYILQDSRAKAVVTLSDLAPLVRRFRGEVIRTDDELGAIEAESPGRLEKDRVGLNTRDLCYIIYTSGSTGRPKGVQVEHRSLCNLILAEQSVYGVEPSDVVCQAASLSFDLSVEEIWLALSKGARLVSVRQEVARAGPDFGDFLATKGVTVLSCVPTLLTMLTEDVPSLRILILGGESCLERLVARWAKPGRRIFNTYGPTETTVIATCASLSVGSPVTLGKPIPGYDVHVLDENLRPVPRGAAGEICVGGVGVARGYVGLPEHTSERFVRDPFSPGDDGARLYRTGDLGRVGPEGNLEFLGRSDSQVKLRGFRVELSEIESVMMEQDEVLAAACAVREEGGVKQLVGYLVPRRGGPVAPDRLRAALRRRLPPYMVPAMFETVPDLPRLPSGKLDRSSLPAPSAPLAGATRVGKRPANDAERKVLGIWEAIFSPQSVSTDDDFFLDLGGHSLLAARMVSELRTYPEFKAVSVADVYEHPTVSGLAKVHSIERDSHVLPVPSSGARGRDRGRRSHAGLGAVLAQTLGLYFSFGFRAFEWVTPYLVFFLLYFSGHTLILSVAWALASAVVVFPVLLVAGITSKWLLLGRIELGRHPLWGGYHLRWWFVHSLLDAVPLDYLAGTPLLASVYRLLGVKVGKGVHIETDSIAAYDIISIGDGASVDEDASLLGYTVEQGELVLGPIEVGRFCYVGTRSVLREGTTMEDGSRIEDLSLLPHGARVPAGQTWSGSPARPAPSPVTAPPRPLSRGTLSMVGVSFLYGALVMSLPILVLAAVVPGVLVLFSINPASEPLLYIAAVPAVGASFVFLVMSELVILKWILVGRVRPGSYPVHGSFYIRNWVVDQLHSLSLDLAAPLHATVYLAPWYRALGARIGENVELSTATSTTPDQLTIEEGATVADEVSLGSARVEGDG